LPARAQRASCPRSPYFRADAGVNRDEERTGVDTAPQRPMTHHRIAVIPGDNKSTFNASGVFAAMFILAALALTAEALITALENRLITWRPVAVADAGL